MKIKNCAAAALALLLLLCFAACGSKDAVDDEKSSTLAAGAITASRGEITDGSAVLEAYRSSDIAFSNEAKLYGMSSETAAQVTYKEGNWQCCVLGVEIKNTAGTDLTVHKINVQNNGKNGVWVCSVSQFGEFDIAAHAKQTMPVTVLVDPAALGGKTVEQVINGMSITLEYTEIADSVGQGAQPSATAAVE